MKHKLFTSLCGLFLLLGCSQSAEEVILDEVTHVVISANDFKSGLSSRTLLDMSTSGAVFSWAAKDTVGIFPNDGAQVYFPMEEGAGTKTASFTGGGWALKNGYTYAAYYPFIGNYYVDKEHLPLSYTGQKQIGNASTAHLGYYDFMAAIPTAPLNGYVNFQFDHLNCLVQMRLTVPVIANFESLSLSCKESIFTTKAELGFMNRTYAFIPKESSEHIDLELEDIVSTSTNQTLTFYIMLAPLDMTGKIIYVTLEDSSGKQYQGILGSNNMQAGYSYDFQVTLEEVTNNFSAENITAPSLGEENEI